MRSLVVTVFGLVLLLGGGAATSAGPKGWELRPIIPSCRRGYFCEKDEIEGQRSRAGIVERLEQMADRALAADGQLSLAFMSFVEPELFARLCALARKGLRIDGFFDSRAGPPSGLGYRLENECQRDFQRDSRRPNVRMFYMGMPKNGKGGWRLHHNKFILAETGSGRVEMAFGSANLSFTGLAVNLENWNFLQAGWAEPFVSDHRCALAAMKVARAARTDQDDPETFRRRLDDCLSWEVPSSSEGVDRALSELAVLTFFAPDPKDRIFLTLKGQIDRMGAGARIRMAAYLFMHKPLAEALHAAVKRGVEVQLLIDDDILSSGVAIPAQKKFYREFIDSSVSGFRIRVYDTNEEIFQMQHNKFILSRT
ncbi:MAG: hypothetical protein HC902_14450 [Calothrix sp. SM1_5_4]|nr:hypothetical protein [Calothrix sp. SM1_5_4]